MLHEAQRTSAPSALSVSISTAVWMVMCSEPADARAAQRLLGAVFLARRHQAGHLGLGDGDFLAAPFGEADVLDDVVGGRLGGAALLAAFDAAVMTILAWLGDAGVPVGTPVGAWL